MNNKIIFDSYVEIRLMEVREYKGTCLSCKNPVETDKSDKPILGRIVFEDDRLWLVQPLNTNLLCPHCFFSLGRMQIWKKESEERKEE